MIDEYKAIEYNCIINNWHRSVVSVSRLHVG